MSTTRARLPQPEAARNSLALVRAAKRDEPLTRDAPIQDTPPNAIPSIPEAAAELAPFENDFPPPRSRWGLNE